MGHWLQLFESVHLLMKVVCKLEKNSIIIMLKLESKGKSFFGNFKYIVKMACVGPPCCSMTCSCVCNR